MLFLYILLTRAFPVALRMLTSDMTCSEPISVAGACLEFLVAGLVFVIKHNYHSHLHERENRTQKLAEQGTTASGTGHYSVENH